MFYFFGEVKSETLFTTVMVLDLIVSCLGIGAIAYKALTDPLYVFGFLLFFLVFALQIACLVYYFKKDHFNTKFHLLYFFLKLINASINLLALLIMVVFRPLMVLFLVIVALPVLVQFWWAWFLFGEIKANLPADVQYQPVPNQTPENRV